MRSLRVSVLLSVLASLTSIAGAQDLRPIGPVAFDIRAFYAGLGQDPITAAGIQVDPTLLPNRGLGAASGLHVYVFRRSSLALGLGVEGILARGHAQQKDETTDLPIGPPITQRLLGFSPQVSLNFGRRQGWSYVSAGLGPLSFSTYQGLTKPIDPPPIKKTINFGFGARWFNTQHLAFCVDMRFYLTRPENATESYPARERSRLLVLSAGVGFK